MRYLKREFGFQYGELPEGFQKPEFKHSLFEYGDVDYAAMANICKPITLGESDFFLHSTSSEGYIKFEPDQLQLQPSDSKWPDFDAWEAFKKSVRSCFLASWILTPSIIWKAPSGKDRIQTDISKTTEFSLLQQAQLCVLNILPQSWPYSLNLLL